MLPVCHGKGRQLLLPLDSNCNSSSVTIIMVLKSRIIKWAGHVAWTLKPEQHFGELIYAAGDC